VVLGWVLNTSPISRRSRHEKEGEGKAVFTLRLLARVPAEKRQEFLESLTTLTAKEGGLCRKLLLKDMTDETLYCWMGDCDSEEELQEFMRSDTFRAIRGAAQVLGTLEDVSIVEIRPGFFGEETT
jgi:hypothetical protein